MKKGRKASFFDGKLSDGTSEVRVVGFSAEQQKKLSKLKEQGCPVQLEDCEIKQSRSGYKMEVILKNATKISESTKEIDIPASTSESSDESIPTTLVQLPSIQNFQKVIVDVKVLEAPQPITVSSGKHKQDVIIADHSATSKVVLWEDHIGSLLETNSYTLKNFVVREYSNIKYLSLPREGSQIIPIDDIGEVEEVDDIEEQQRREIFDAQIIAVPYLDTYKSCIRCKARVEPLSPPLGRCSKEECLMSQRYDFCGDQCSAKLMLQCGQLQGKDVITLHAFGNILSELTKAEGEDVTVESLLNSPKLSLVKYNDKMIITSFSTQ